jgi:hypothetical protein
VRAPPTAMGVADVLLDERLELISGLRGSRTASLN